MTRTRQGVRLGVFAIVGWVAVAGPARAQVTTADVIGRVTDTSGGALPGATGDDHQPGDRRHPHPGDLRDRRLHVRSAADRHAIRSRSNCRGSAPSPATCGCRPAIACASTPQLAVGTAHRDHHGDGAGAAHPVRQRHRRRAAARNRRAGPAAQRPQRHRPGAQVARAPTRACPTRCRAATGPTIAGRRPRCRSTARTTS